MLLTVKKQVEETVEVKTPAFYKIDLLQKHYFISDNQIICVCNRMVYMWGPDMGKTYSDEIIYVLDHGQECTKEEFDKAYLEVMEKFENATGLQLNY